jgi:formylglycine-generating enzyme required for sulfatase activity
MLNRKSPNTHDSGIFDDFTGMEFIFVPGGCFTMGKQQGLCRECSDDSEFHKVCVNDIAIGKYEVTVDQFSRFVKQTGYQTDAEKYGGCKNISEIFERRKLGRWLTPPMFFQKPNEPVVCVSYTDVNEYINWLNSHSDNQYRLPTEAEWEYVARSRGKDHRYAGNPTMIDLYRYSNFCDKNCSLFYNAWVNRNYNDGHRFTSPVGQYLPNEMGLYDMTGNVYEMVSDWYSEDYYAESPLNDPKGPLQGEFRTVRGGSWRAGLGLTGGDDELDCATRSFQKPNDSEEDVGFRLVKIVKRND